MVLPFSKAQMKICHQCGGLIQKDAPREYRDGYAYHPHCAFRHDEDIKAKATQL